MSNEFLKGCPFCNTEPVIRYSHGKALIECDNAKCTTRPSTWLYVKTDSVKRLVLAWNYRKGDD